MKIIQKCKFYNLPYYFFSCSSLVANNNVYNLKIILFKCRGFVFGIIKFNNKPIISAYMMKTEIVFTRFLYVSTGLLFREMAINSKAQQKKSFFVFLSVPEQQAENALTHFNRFETAPFFVTRVNILDQQQHFLLKLLSSN